MTAKLWWIIQKDLTSEYRARHAWPAMLVLGIVVAVVFSLQMDLRPDAQRQICGGLLWLAILFAGMLALDRSFAMEREENCGEGLLLYPVSATTVYLAKLAVNVVALAALELILIPLFAALTDVPLFLHPGPMALVALLGTVGIAAIGTPLGALAAKIPERTSLSGLLVLPLAIPVVLAAAEATRLIAENDLGAAWWRWVQLLAAFGVVFTASGAVLFEVLVEE